MMKPKLVCVTWIDANSERTQLSKAEALNIKLPTVQSYGILLQDNKRRVVVAGEVLTDGKETTYRDTTAIPRGMVIEVRRIA